MLRILTSKSPLGRLFLVAASPYASKNGGLRINSTRPAHKNPITTRKWKTCSMSDSHSFLDLLRRKYACIVQENMKISTGSQKRSNDQSTSGELINYFLSTYLRVLTEFLRHLHENSRRYIRRNFGNISTSIKNMSV